MAERIVNLSPVHNILVSDNAFSGDWTTECPSVYLTSLVFSILGMLPSERVRNLASSGIELGVHWIRSVRIGPSPATRPGRSVLQYCAIGTITTRPRRSTTGRHGPTVDASQVPTNRVIMVNGWATIEIHRASRSIGQWSPKVLIHS